MTAALHWLAVLATAVFTLVMAFRVVTCPQLRAALGAFVRMLLGSAVLCLLARAVVPALAVGLLAGLAFAATVWSARRWPVLLDEGTPADRLVYEPWLAAAGLGFLLLASLGIARAGLAGENTSPIRALVQRLETEPPAAATDPLASAPVAPEADAPRPPTALLVGLAGLLVLVTVVTSHAILLAPVSPGEHGAELANPPAPAESTHVE